MDIDDRLGDDSAATGQPWPLGKSPPAAAQQATDSALNAPLYRIETVKQLKDRARVRWLIRKLLTRNGFVVMYGEPGHGKSFVALDIALRLAMGLAWGGFRPARGLVLYVLAEGTGGAPDRLIAWEKSTGLTLAGNQRFLLEAVQLTSLVDARRLVRSLEEAGFKPDLIVIDTLARCFVGGDENSAKDMGQLVAAVQFLQRATGATVLLLHHTTKRRADASASAERGSGALRGAADTMIRVTTDKQDRIRVDLDKQKDGVEWKGLLFKKEVIETSVDEDGESVTSLALVLCGQAVAQDKGAATHTQLTTPKQQTMLEILTTATGHTLPNVVWRKATGFAETTFRANQERLKSLGLIKPTEEGAWTVTPAGLAAAIPPPFARRGGDPNLGPAAATPPPGGGVSGDGDDDDDGVPDEFWL